MKKARMILLSTIIVIVLVLLIFGKAFLDLLLNLKEHMALGYYSVYVKELVVSLSSTYVTAIVFLILALLSLLIFRKYVRKSVFILFSVIVAVVGFLVGFAIGHIDPTSWLLFFNHQSFGKVDPIFHKDISFYVYVLPILQSIIGKLIGAVIFFIIIRLGVTLFFTALNYIGEDFHLKTARYLSIFGAILFLLIAINIFLSRYSLLYTAKEGNFLYGPNFTQTHLTIPVTIWVETALSVIVAITFLTFAFKKRGIFQLFNLRNYKSIMLSIASLIVISIIFSGIGLAINRFYVHPNQQTVEAPYIKRTIDATRWAVDINKVKTTQFKTNNTMDQSIISQNQNLLDNIRINDIGQTKEIYNQLQSFKSYFVFKGANADRYNGKEVYIDVRQLDNTKLPVQTWINKNLVYTHGYGVAASPVNTFNDKGLPVTLAENTPQKTQAPIPTIKQPNIYFGTMSNEVVAPSKQGEFDYPLKSADHTSHYKGGYNLPLKGNKLLLAIEKKNLKFLTSGQFTSDSQLVFDRNIYKRVKDIAPFIKYDSDAYPFVTADGHVKWMMDAYTQSSTIPYAQNFSGTSYIRNSLKVVIDAYTGKVTFYVIDKNDPMIQSLMKIYPDLFTTKIPSNIAKHFRYPRDLFSLQSKAITTYHMTNPAAFYNQEDLWGIAQEVYQQNQTKERAPVYQMIQMPGIAKPSFVLSELFTPNKKMNLNGWLIANNDPKHYGDLTLYQFPQSNLFFGPMQAENEIDSNTTISSQLSLWNQNGSQVVRGNLLLVPIAKTAMYIEPIYLVANRAGALPQLQRVVVDFNEKVYMGNTLADAMQMMINDIAGNSGGGTQAPSGNKTGQKQGNPSGKNNKTTPSGPNQTVQQLAKQANDMLNQYKKDTASGDYAKAGQDMQQVQQLLQQMLNAK